MESKQEVHNMSTSAEVRNRGLSNGSGAEFEHWQQSARVWLQPIAAPSILGLFGFAAATFMVSTNLAGWYGNATSSVYLFPFAAVFGGVAQFAAGMWAYRARDGLATAMHGMWGSFWVAYGILWLLVAAHDIVVPSGKFPELAFWFFPLAAITASGAVASLRENLSLTATLSSLSVGSALLGVGYLVGGSAWLHAGGWVLFASAVCAFYGATAMMLKASFGRVILPVGEPQVVANIPGREFTHPIEYSHGEPGVKQGQ
jgi:succinate-acetate transporter protein